MIVSKLQTPFFCAIRKIGRQRALWSDRFIVLNNSAGPKNMVIKIHLIFPTFFQGFRVV